MLPPRLKAGSHVRVLAPSCTLPSVKWMTETLFAEAKAFFERRGMTVSEGNYLRESDAFESASIAHRIEDLHSAFRDPEVDAIVTIRGGWNCNQLLKFLDYDLIKKNPKILCGFSDITALSNAILAKTGLVTYSGPNFHAFALSDQIPYTCEAFLQCLQTSDPMELRPSPVWSDAHVLGGQINIPFEPNDGWWNLGDGEAEGTIVGANLCTFILLQGTEFMPSLKNTILFLEDDYETHPRVFERQLQSLLQQPDFAGVKGIAFGRFDRVTANRDMKPITRETLEAIVGTKKELKGLPIIANADFGHTHPIFTFPIGGHAKLSADGKDLRLTLVTH